jgi:hypothetical protein
MNVCGIAKQEHAPSAEVVRNAVMHMVRREPIDLHDVELEMLDRFGPHVFKGEGSMLLARWLARRPYEADALPAFHGKNEYKIGIFEVDVEISFIHWLGQFHVGNVEVAWIGCAREIVAKLLPHRRGGTVAARKVSSLADELATVRPPKSGVYATVKLGERDQLSTTLYRYSQNAQTLDEKPLVVVLRIYQKEWVRGQAHAELLERHSRDATASSPEIEMGDLGASGDHRVGDPDLSVELQCPNVDGQSAGRRARLSGLIDNSHGDTKSGQPERKDQSGRPGSDDQNLGIHYEFILQIVKVSTPAKLTQAK